MRFPVLFTAAVLCCSSINAQRNCVFALYASAQLTTALISRDTIAIKKLVDPAIGYGHSNGWVESRNEIIRDLFDGTLRYDAIRLLDTPTCALREKTAVIRHRIEVTITMSETKLRMNLGVLQLWIYRRGRWALIARQAGRIS